MKPTSFFLQLGAIFTSLILVQALLSSVLPAVGAHWLLFWLAQGLFVVISVLLYWLGDKAGRNSNKNLFSQLVMGATFFKMMLSVVCVIVYFKKTMPEGKWFLIPFFVTYMVYTIFETYFMAKLGKNTSI